MVVVGLLGSSVKDFFVPFKVLVFFTIFFFVGCFGLWTPFFFLFLGSKLVDAKIDVRAIDWEFSSCRAFDGLPGRFFPDWAVVIAEVRSALAVANNLGGSLYFSPMENAVGLNLLTCFL